MAHKILPENDIFAAICAIDVSGKDQRLRSDLCVGKAEPGFCVSAGETVDAFNNGSHVMGRPSVCVQSQAVIGASPTTPTRLRDSKWIAVSRIPAVHIWPQQVMS